MTHYLLREFIVLARQSTYASGNQPQLLEMEKAYKVEKGPFKYQDVYYDSERVFQGQEVVFFERRPIWSCSYRGVVNEDKDAKRTFQHLRHFLTELVNKTRFECMCNLESGEWKYVCDGRGDAESFSGMEQIYYLGEEVYQMEYFGGVL